MCSSPLRRNWPIGPRRAEAAAKSALSAALAVAFVFTTQSSAAAIPRSTGAAEWGKVATDGSGGWVLSTDDAQRDYHPTFVGNGYLGARIPAAGQGWADKPIPTQFELAGLYSTPPDTTAVKPSLPAWSSLDISEGESGASAALGAGKVSKYRQSLDLRTGTLTTTARWTSPSGRTADLRYRLVADRARKHVAVVHLEMVPRWTGTATVTDLIDDRAAEHLKSPVRGSSEDKHQVWETRRAEGNSTQVAIASQLDAPGRITPMGGDVTGQRATVRVTAGVPVNVTKFVGIASTQDSTDALATARQQSADATRVGWARLTAENAAAWRKLWRARVEVQGDSRLRRQVLASQFYLLASVRAGSPWSPSPAGLSSDGYNGHVFWDTETWMYPSVLAQHPDIAKSMLQYRINRIDAARKYAKDGGYSGTRFPWESALSGLEDTPSWASTGRYEQHISSDISLAVWQYWLATGDRTWLRDKGAEILRGVADFWVSRVTRNADGSSSINGVTPPDEYVENIDDSAYTNMAARDSLHFAVQAAKIFGQPANPQWSRVADSLRIPFDAKTGTHPEYDGYAGKRIKQADVVLMRYPWENPQSAEVTRADMARYVPRTDPDGPSMTDSVHSIISSELGDPGCAAMTYTKRSVDPFIRAPFEQFAEARSGGAFTFMTGTGGFLQEFLYGYSGMRWRDDRVYLDPTLPPQLTGISMRELSWQGRKFTMEIGPHQTTVRLLNGAAMPVEVRGQSKNLRPGQQLKVPTRRPDLAPTIDLARCAAISADSSDPSSPAVAAVDGDAQTFWQAKTPDPALTVNLERPRRLRTLTADWGDERPKQYTVELSRDGHHWTPAATVEGGQTKDTVDLEERTAALVRLKIGGEGDDGPQLHSLTLR